jgi:hypothetical protein
MTDSVTYTQPVTYEWQFAKRCANCRHWDLSHAVDGYATCHLLVYGWRGWRMATREQVQGSAAIVRTHAKFECKFWEAKE